MQDVEIRRARRRNYYWRNRDKCKERAKRYYQRNRQKCNASRTAYRQATKEIRNAQKRVRYEANPEKFKARNKAWRAANREKLRIAERRKLYNLSPEQFDQILAVQGSKCAICRVADFTPVVDHCHSVGHTRGILCHKCNTMLGLARHSVEILTNALKYMSKEVLFNE